MTISFCPSTAVALAIYPSFGSESRTALRDTDPQRKIATSFDSDEMTPSHERRSEKKDVQILDNFFDANPVVVLIPPKS
jgi:hypothetical protein